MCKTAVPYLKPWSKKNKNQSLLLLLSLITNSTDRCSRETVPVCLQCANYSILFLKHTGIFLSLMAHFDRISEMNNLNRILSEYTLNGIYNESVTYFFTKDRLHASITSDDRRARC